MTRRSLIAPAAIVFDFDLTLVDSRPGFIASHRYAAEQRGVPALEPAVISRAIGTPLELIVPREYPGMSETEVAEYIRVYRQRADAVMADMTQALPGATEAVAYLNAEGLKLAIVSQKLRRLIEPVLAREGMKLDVVVGAEDLPAFKPDPRGVLLALDRLGVEPDDAIFVGDTTIDAEAAANAGVRFIGLLSGVTPSSEFDPYPHVAILERVGDLPEYLGL